VVNRHGQASVRFGVFELDLAAGELRKRGLRMKLQRQPFQILLALLERPGELVSRPDLRNRLWPDNVFLNFEHELNKALNKLRLALSDDARSPRFIETHFGQGYRFIAPVQTDAREPRATHGGVFRIAVLPFVHLASDPEQQIFADSLTAGTIGQLGALYPDRLRVIARSSVFRYWGSLKPLGEIAKELGVDYLLIGTTRSSGTRVRLTVELVHAEEQVCLWTHNYDHEVSDPFAFQHEIARGIAESLKLELRPERLAAYERSRGHDAHAREAYLKGRYHWSGRTEASLRKSLAYFREAIAADPKHALAHVGLAESYVVMGNSGMLAPDDAITFARDAVLRALDINHQLAEAHASLGWIRFAHDRDWAASEHEFELVSKLNPNYVSGPHWHAYSLGALGDFDRALVINRQALLIDPLSLPANAARSWLLFLARRYDQAIEQCKATIELDPMHWLGHHHLAMAYTAKRQHENALVEYEIAQECSSDLPMLLACCGHGYAAAGDFASAQRVLDELAIIRKTRYVPSYWVALVYAGLGLADEVFDWLQRAYDEHCEWVAFMNVDPRLEHLRADPRFQSLASKLHLPSADPVETEAVTPSKPEVLLA
jgi:TolB-like protein/Tfp pilus assembly protein PilF